MSIHVADIIARNKSLTAKRHQQGYRYHKLRKTFSKFYRRRYELVSKFNVGFKHFLHQGLSEPEFYGDLVYILNIKEKLHLTRLTQEHIWIFLDRELPSVQLALFDGIIKTISMAFSRNIFLIYTDMFVFENVFVFW